MAEANAAIDDLTAGRVAGFTGLMLERSAAGQFEALPAEERYRCVRKLWYFCRVDPRMDRIARSGNIQSIVAHLSGGQATRMFQDMALLWSLYNSSSWV